ncbi:MAG: choice-of-anchor L domain-containing protein [Bacteroidales bacterium]|jgi:gliding motility-associated-like protein|nr:choice-of-anchor L domain-containing protein [Bacteroidales bacterium]
MKKGVCFALKILGIGCFFSLSSITVFSQISVQTHPTWTAQQLVDAKLAGPGVEIINAKFNNLPAATLLSYNCIGSFSSPTSTLMPYSSGIIMTTGNIENALGPNNSDYKEMPATPSNVTTLYTSAPGTMIADPYLIPIAAPNTVTTLTKLEFDFKSFSSVFNFHYIFASEEYPEYACTQFTDCFGFFVTGLNPITGGLSNVTWNIAVIPNSVTLDWPDGTPVSINSLNNGHNNDGIPCTGYGFPTLYNQYYVSNGLSGNYETQYNGLTTDMVAKGIIYPCDFYHMSLSIANASDLQLGSGVFLQEGSFSSPAVEGDVSHDMVGLDTLLATCNSIYVDFHSEYPNYHPINITIDTVGLGGSAVWNADYKIAVVRSNGTEQNISVGSTFIIGAEDTATRIRIYADQTTTILPNEVKSIAFSLEFVLCSNSYSNPASHFSDTLRFVMKGHDPLRLALTTPDTVKDCIQFDGSLGVYAATGKIGTLRWEPALGLTNPTSPTTGATVTENSTYRVYAIDSYGCWRDTIEVRVELFDVPKAIFTPQGAIGCEPFSVTFNSTSTPNNAELLWLFGDGDSSTNVSVQHIYDAAGLYRAWLYVSTAPECADSTFITIDVKDKPHASFIFGPPDPLNGRPVYFSDMSASNYPLTYQWSFGDGSSSSDINPVYTYHVSNTEYFNVRLLVSNANGCADDTLVPLIVEDRYAYYMPTAFSPNGDGLNDLFAPSITDVLDYTLSIYDRWGNLIFFTHEPLDAWGGYDKKGNQCPMGNYVWMISFKKYSDPDILIIDKGVVTLIR